MGTELPKATIEEMRKLRTLAQLGDYADTRVCIGAFQREWEHSGRPLGDFDKWLALKAASLVGAGPWPNP